MTARDEERDYALALAGSFDRYIAIGAKPAEYTDTYVHTGSGGGVVANGSPTLREIRTDG